MNLFLNFGGFEFFFSFPATYICCFSLHQIGQSQIRCIIFTETDSFSKKLSENYLFDKINRIYVNKFHRPGL